MKTVLIVEDEKMIRQGNQNNDYAKWCANRDHYGVQQWRLRLKF